MVKTGEGMRGYASPHHDGDIFSIFGFDKPVRTVYIQDIFRTYVLASDLRRGERHELVAPSGP